MDDLKRHAKTGLECATKEEKRILFHNYFASYVADTLECKNSILVKKGRENKLSLHSMYGTKRNPSSPKKMHKSQLFSTKISSGSTFQRK